MKISTTVFFGGGEGSYEILIADKFSSYTFHNIFILEKLEVKSNILKNE